MTNYMFAVLIGFLLHMMQKYVLSPGWKVSDFVAGEWRYVITSLVLTALLGFYGPDIIGIVLQGMGIGGEMQAALNSSPHLIGTLIGLSGGSLAYNLPLIGPVIKDLFKPRNRNSAA
jgi:hypothetical protein